MRPISILLFLSSFFSPRESLVAQSAKIDSLLAVLKTQTQDSNRVNTLVALCRERNGKDNAKALEHGEAGLQLADKLSFQRGMARAYVELGQLYNTKGDKNNAQEYLERGLKHAEEKNEAKTITRALFALSDLHRAQGKIDRAMSHAQEALKTAEAANDKAAIAASLNTLGIVQSIQGRYGQALDSYNRSLTLQEELGDTPAIASVLNNIGTIHLKQGRFEQALDFHRNALKLQEELGDKYGIASSFTNIGHIHTRQGRYEQALDSYQNALKLREELGDKSGTASALINIGNIHSEQGRFGQALDFYQRSLDINEELGNRLGIATASFCIGNIHYDQGRYEQALDFYQHSLKTNEELGNKYGIALALYSIGNIHFTQGRYEEALNSYQSSLKVKEELGDASGIAKNLTNIGKIHAEFGRYDSAIVYMTRGYALAKRIGSIEPMKSALEVLSTVFALQNDFVNAYEYHKQYTTLKDSLVNEANLKSINEMTAKYEAEKREQKIALLEKDKSLSGLELRRQQEELQRQQLESIQKQQQLDLLGKEKEIQTLTLAGTNIELEKQRIENEKKNNEVSLLTKDKQLQSSLLERETLIRNVFIGGLGVVLLLTIGLYNRYRYKKRTTEQLTSTLHDLQRTQQQLIHAEKMATLGELTAGIAHEIKNPLNFVTNFSDISRDIIEEIEGAPSHEEGRVLFTELKENLARIREHGHRADSIVRGMMLHAQGTPGAMIPTDINDLLEEAISLAYHGMRATHEGFHVRIEKDYSPSLPSIPVVRQEISRVLLNILNNAMYAATQSPLLGGDVRRTEGGAIWITTIQRNDYVEIRIRDNGPGIPDEIKYKVFQPFFTTKPTGEGTGLGLSMSYDIVVKGHGGTLACESNGDGAEFIVTLPETA